MAEPAAAAVPVDALGALASLLRSEDSVISPHVVDPPDASPVLGLLAAAGPRTSASASEYAFVVEAVREGYELHYGRARVIAAADRDLELLAGDYLYALGLERLAALGDLEAVRELSDLISLAARVHDRGEPPERVAEESAALWIAAAAAIAGGSDESLRRAKGELREGAQAATASLRSAAERAAADGGFTKALGEASAGLDSRPSVG
jgi:hypothetical protein